MKTVQHEYKSFGSPSVMFQNPAVKEVTEISFVVILRIMFATQMKAYRPYA
jgi:hypothetical protein